MNKVSNKRLLLITFGNTKYDGRLNILIGTLQRFFFITTLSPFKDSLPLRTKSLIFLSWHSRDAISRFFKMIFLTARQIKKADLIFIDNRKASALFYCINLFIRTDKVVIQDMREFYTTFETYSLYSKIGTCFEHLQAKNSNLVIVCNDYRKRLLSALLPIKKIIVFENKRALVDGFLSPLQKNDLIDSIKGGKIYLDKEKINFISTGGINFKRGCGDIIKAVKKRSEARLFFIGKASQHDLIEFNRMTVDCKNIFYLGEIPYTSLAELLSRMDVGVVNYAMDNLNNRYCASGKVYEYLSIGIPILSTSNKPLLKTIKKYNCGISCYSFDTGIDKMISSHMIFRNNINQNSIQSHIKNYNQNFGNLILDALNINLKLKSDPQGIK